jgi:hypothetical protein
LLTPEAFCTRLKEAHSAPRLPAVDILLLYFF